jgi:Cu/Ag efflux protein CusF
MMKQNLLPLLAATALSVGMLSCRQEGSSVPPRSAVAKTNLQTYQVKGVIKELVPERKKVKIAHEDIPNYMEAMTMMLDVRDANELTGLQVGDTVSFRMLVTDDDGWIDQLKKLDGPRTPLPPEPTTFRRVRDVETAGSRRQAARLHLYQHAGPCRAPG